MLKHLSMIFGSNVGPIYLGSFANPILNEIFEKFNLCVLSVGAVILSFVLIVSTINTAKDGQIMGGKHSSVWTPMRSILGISLMVPMPGSGYSMLQAFVLWVIIQGCNVANQTWEIVVEYLEQGVSVAKAVELSSRSREKLQEQGQEITKQLLNSAICMASIKQIVSGHATYAMHETIPASSFIAGYGKSISINQTTPILIHALTQNSQEIEYNSHFNFGVRQRGFEPDLQKQYAEICGGFKIQAIVSAVEIGNKSRKNASFRAKDAVEKKVNALSAMLESLQPLVDKIVTFQDGNSAEDYTASINKHIKLGGVIYRDMISTLIKPDIKSEQSDQMQQLKDTDWTAIGAVYASLSESREIELLKTAIEHKPMPTMLPGTIISSVPSCNIVKLREKKNYHDIPELSYLRQYISTEDEITYICKKLSVVYEALFYNNKITWAEPQNNTRFAQGVKVEQTLQVMQKLIGDAFAQLKKEIENNGVDGPIASQANFGKALITAAEERLLHNDSSAINLTMLVPSILWLCGAMLVFYVPLIPCLMYTVAVLGWFLLVIENFFVLPIVALGLIMPSRDETGMLAQNLALPINTTLRPVLMVINFILAIRLYSIAVELINFVMVNVVSVNFINASLLSPVISIVIYVVLIAVAANMCFSLAYKIPNKVALFIKSSLATHDIHMVVQPATPHKNVTLTHQEEIKMGITSKIDPSGMGMQ